MPGVNLVAQLVAEEHLHEKERLLIVAARDANHLQDELLAADRDVLKLGTRVKVLGSQLATARQRIQELERIEALVRLDAPPSYARSPSAAWLREGEA